MVYIPNYVLDTLPMVLRWKPLSISDVGFGLEVFLVVVFTNEVSACCGRLLRKVVLNQANHITCIVFCHHKVSHRDAEIEISIFRIVVGLFLRPEFKFLCHIRNSRFLSLIF